MCVVVTCDPNQGALWDMYDCLSLFEACKKKKKKAKQIKAI